MAFTGGAFAELSHQLLVEQDNNGITNTDLAYDCNVKMQIH